MTMIDKTQWAKSMLQATNLKTIIGLFLTFGAIIIIWKLPHFLSLSNTPAVRELSTVAQCDLTEGACYAKLDEVEIALSIEPKQFSSLKPLLFTAEISGLDATEAILDLQGKEMYMGINQTPLTLNPNTRVWTGVTELAVCTTGSMLWQASVIARENDQTTPIKATFEFVAQ
ncbi:hypothetical protein [Neptunomonas concharum]|uniref:Uncharacterized protein n=1 Tax=Neptunomonas concharum TaxID=1031538 RepID=A0A5P1RAP9_9GAMM|nr:hypothetical protein [Neptunomonas concharum]QEQ96366.1 hypothetical protein F0U83_06410 [Neptunomonas concharum]